MAILKVKLFGIPEVRLDDVEINFPFKKADALFYYLLLVKKTTRDHLVNLFWADSDENVAKKNLRNAIYIIKKTLGVEVFLSPQRSMIELNSEIELELDIDVFILETETSVDVYSGPLIEGMNIKGCENYDNWLINQRQYYETLYIQKTLNISHKLFDKQAYKQVEKYCIKLIKIDPFDESIYRMLMKSYFESGRYDKSIALYDELVTLLDDELSISPDELTLEIYEKIIQKRSQARKKSKKESDRFFFGRTQPLEKLIVNYQSYLRGKEYFHFLIQGELGVGKTALMNELIAQLKSEHVEVVRVYCYQAIEGFNLKAWDDLIEKLGVIVDQYRIKIPEFVKLAIVSTFPSFEKRGLVTSFCQNEEHIFKKRTVENAIYELIKIVTGAVKLLLVFEDIQWLDEPSQIMLKKLINERYVDNPVVYVTCRNAHGDTIEKFISEFSSRSIISRIQLERFGEKETLEFVEAYTGKKLDDRIDIYQETEGNAFFIIELLNSIKQDEFNVLSSKVKDAMKHRLFNISKDSLQVIQLASVYLTRFTVEDIIKISEKSEFAVLDLIEELENMYLIKEELDDEGDAVYSFTHRKIKEYVYNSFSLSKQKILHTRIAKRIEDQMLIKSDRNGYSRLIYHYGQANNALKALEFRIKNLYEYLQSSHEVFPLIKERDVFNHESIFFTEEEIEDEFDKIEKLFLLLKKDYIHEHLTELQLKFKHMTGRHYINNGFYDKGLKTIADLIEISKEKDQYNYLVKGYLQNIFYSINTHNMPFMAENLSTALKIAHKEEMRYEIGILLRLKGLYFVLKSQFDKGEALLLRSIEMMKKFKEKDKYTLNIAAAYYYMGDSNRFKGNFDQSIKYYEMAIEICENNDLLGRLTVFYTNAGHSAYNLGDYLLAQRYFESAIKLYEQLDFPWRRSIAYGFLGLLHVKQGKDKKALDLFVMADRYSSKLNNPYEQAVVCRIKAELEQMLLEGNIFSTKLQTFIESGGEDYVETGIYHLRNFKDCYEMKRLQELKMNRHFI